MIHHWEPGGKSFLWAKFGDKIKFKDSPSIKYTHWNWFKSLGIKDTTDLMRDGKRGRIEYDPKTKEIYGLTYSGDSWDEYQFMPNDVVREFRSKYPSFSKYTMLNPGESMYSKTAVNSYARGTSPKRSYKRNVLPVGASSLASSLLGGEVMSRAKEWAMGKRSKLGRKLHNASIYDYELAWKQGRELGEQYPKMLAKDTIKEQFDIWWNYHKDEAEPKSKSGNYKAYVRGYRNKISNPSSEPISPEVEDMSKSWHGRDVGDVTEVEELESFESDLVELGDLEELGILELGTISFKKDQPKLCCDGEGHNLEIVGGDQELDLDSEGVEFKGKRLIPLGYLYSIVYVTDKHHLEGSNGYPEPYEHYFGEEFYKKYLPIEDFDDDTDVWFETLEDMGVVQKAIEKGLLPTCVYDKTDGKILIAGGEYTITELGIKD
jgi:hypothetical protein